MAGIREYYIRGGHLSFELDSEHTDGELTAAEMAILAPWLDGVRNAFHLCCGAGRHVRAFARKGILSLGLDISPYLLGRGLEEIRTEGLETHSAVLRADALAIPASAGCIDCLTLLGNSFVFFSDREAHCLLKEARRVLRPGGIFALDIPCHQHMTDLIRRRDRETGRLTSTSLGQVSFTWQRDLEEGTRVLVSREVVEHNAPDGRMRRMEMLFRFRLYRPEEICSLLDSMKFSLMAQCDCLGPPGRYRGMLKKRILFLFRR
ncbi:MAG: class I SAM-dependent methyltransferase [Deltaproteobacteria bacterium]|nr:class I SAM-dependent methyltransferase [Deltaproteobacteria bacterium]MBW1948529.1 class I SAM-dependent methyltransferase [Deltaproteobacteria bacterium]MBW2008445.1 class I SAM-dependent methyltransferase [Deltaproteobacteria bacterium]